jgi:ABC-type sulfate/molybdate transport systems ATPase subunit
VVLDDVEDEVSRLAGGASRASSSVSARYDQPEGPFVAGFIGVSNLLPGDDGAQISVRPEKIWLGDLEHGPTTAGRSATG